MAPTRSAHVAGLARRRLRSRLWPIVQTAAAAVAAWYLAEFLLGVAQPLFAPVAAVIALGATYGQSGRRALELAGGVVLGVSIADVIVHAIGTGPWQAGVMIVLAMGAAVALGGGELLVSEAGVSAILIVTLNPTGDLSLNRFLEAIIGGGVALLASVFLFPPDPVLRVARAMNIVFGELGRVLGDLARALEAGDAEAAARAQQAARAIDDHVVRVRTELAELRDTARFAPPRRRARGPMARYERGLPQLAYAVGDTRVLARVALRHVRSGRESPPELIDAIDALAVAVWDLAGAYDAAAREPAVRETALGAAARLEAAAERSRDVRLAELVAQVRSLAVDLVRAADLAAGSPESDAEHPTEELVAGAR